VISDPLTVVRAFATNTERENKMIIMKEKVDTLTTNFPNEREGGYFES